MNARPVLKNAAARALFLDRHGLAAAPSGSAKGPDLQGVVDALGFVQVDSINTVARAHHMILHARRTAYRPAALARLHDVDRGVFEHWTHDASLISMAHFPHWRLKFRRYEHRLAAKWDQGRRAGFTGKIEEVLRQISDHGPCCSAEVGVDEARSPGGWWDWHPSKAALEYLWRIGHLSVTRREAFRKVYDLTENVIPPEYLNARFHEAETVDWACASALDRLGFATSGELAAFWDLISPAEAKAWTPRALERADLVEAEVEQADGRWRTCVLRPETLDAAPAAVTQRLRILSPFDPALRDRNRAERLFGFHYRIEVFVPEAQRKYGYYVFPILEGDRLVGRIDMKADRALDRLNVRALWPEHGVRWGAGRLARLDAALDRSARLAGVGEITYEAGWLR
ncbi:MAG: crosslink repair DNA glycosylase YcaQ family protein [Jannaschia sp.]